ncbi:hypothetical protein C8Q77DRAFT_718535 [Trametes polyzona]|nr:hypothetical protein C8Q77DRAFT_718535 [Trametes polyzona]
MSAMAESRVCRGTSHLPPCSRTPDERIWVRAHGPAQTSIQHPFYLNRAALLMVFDQKAVAAILWWGSGCILAGHAVVTDSTVYWGEASTSVIDCQALVLLLYWSLDSCSPVKRDAANDVGGQTRNCNYDITYKAPCGFERKLAVCSCQGAGFINVTSEPIHRGFEDPVQIQTHGPVHPNAYRIPVPNHPVIAGCPVPLKSKPVP